MLKSHSLGLAPSDTPSELEKLLKVFIGNVKELDPSQIHPDAIDPHIEVREEVIEILTAKKSFAPKNSVASRKLTTKIEKLEQDISQLSLVKANVLTANVSAKQSSLEVDRQLKEDPLWAADLDVVIATLTPQDPIDQEPDAIEQVDVVDQNIDLDPTQEDESDEEEQDSDLDLDSEQESDEEEEDHVFDSDNDAEEEDALVAEEAAEDEQDSVAEETLADNGDELCEAVEAAEHEEDDENEEREENDDENEDRDEEDYDETADNEDAPTVNAADDAQSSAAIETAELVANDLDSVFSNSQVSDAPVDDAVALDTHRVVADEGQPADASATMQLTAEACAIAEAKETETLDSQTQVEPLKADWRSNNRGSSAKLVRFCWDKHAPAAAIDTAKAAASQQHQSRRMSI